MQRLCNAAPTRSRHSSPFVGMLEPPPRRYSQHHHQPASSVSHTYGSALSWPSPAALQVIKGYSPDIAVHPYLRESPAGEPLAKEHVDELAEAAASEVEAWFTRLDCLVVGPGVSRDPLMLETARRVMLKVGGCACDDHGMWVPGQMGMCCFKWVPGQMGMCCFKWVPGQMGMCCFKWGRVSDHPYCSGAHCAP
jgi:hypothetical protein